jgi:enamine deaminase RidA (YjgF/YER057c/UK114 family)
MPAMSPQVINPASLGAPKGYSNGVLMPAGGRILFVAGQVGWTATQQIVSESFPEQFGRALQNVLEVVTAAGGEPEHIGRLTLYVTNKQEYLSELRAVGEKYRSLMGKHFPAMALVEVKGLVEAGAKVEIEATAVLPSP